MYPFALLAALGEHFPDNVIQYDSRTNHRAVLFDNGDLYVQGDGTNGGLGNGSSAATYAMNWARVLTDVKRMAVGPYITLALKNDGTFWYTGGAGTNAGPSITQTLVFTDVTNKLIPVTGEYTADDIVDFRIDNSHTVILLANGDLWGGGTNAMGQLGRGNTAAVNTITKIASGVAKVATALQFTAYVSTTGELYVAGYQATRYGIGGATANLTTFTKVTSLYPFDSSLTVVKDLWIGKDDSSGENSFMIAVNNSGGSQDLLMIGNFDDPNTAATNTLSKYNFLSGKVLSFNPRGSSTGNSYAVTADGEIYVFGVNTSGMLGIGSTTTPVSPNAVALPLPTGITADDVVCQTFESGNQQFVARGQLYKSGVGGKFESSTTAVSVLTKVTNFPSVG